MLGEVYGEGFWGVGGGALRDDVDRVFLGVGGDEVAVVVAGEDFFVLQTSEKNPSRVSVVARSRCRAGRRALRLAAGTVLSMMYRWIRSSVSFASGSGLHSQNITYLRPLCARRGGNEAPSTARERSGDLQESSGNEVTSTHQDVLKPSDHAVSTLKGADRQRMRSGSGAMPRRTNAA